MLNTQTIEAATTEIPLAERNVIEVLLNAPELLPIAAERITPEDFTSPALHTIARHIWRLAPNGHLCMETLLFFEELVSLGYLLVNMAAAGRDRGNYKATLIAAADHIVFRGQHRSEIDALRAAAAAGDDDSLRKLTELFRQHDCDVRDGATHEH